MTLDNDNDTIAFYLTVHDDQATDKELQAMLVALMGELENLSAVVEPVPETEAVEQGMIAKGEKGSNIFNIEINLETLKTFAKWLYERLMGTSTKVKFEYGEAKFEFEGRNDLDRASAQKDFEDFVLKLEAAKKVKLEAAEKIKNG